MREAIAVGIPIRASPVLRLRAAPRSLSQLGTPVVGIRAELSTSRHSSQLHCRPSNGPSVRLDRTYTRSHHTSRPSGRRRVRPFPSALTRDGASVFGPDRYREFPIRDTVRPGEMDPLGFEPRASSLQRRHSTTELWARRASAVRGCPVGETERTNWVGASPRSRSVGGDPAADSPTATLLRLNPPCEAQIRPPNGGLIQTSLG